MILYLSGLFNSTIQRLKPRLASHWLVVPLRRRVLASSDLNHKLELNSPVVFVNIYGVY